MDSAIILTSPFVSFIGVIFHLWPFQLAVPWIFSVDIHVCASFFLNCSRHFFCSVCRFHQMSDKHNTTKIHELTIQHATIHPLTSNIISGWYWVNVCNGLFHFQVFGVDDSQDYNRPVINENQKDLVKDWAINSTTVVLEEKRPLSTTGFLDTEVEFNFWWSSFFFQ